MTRAPGSSGVAGMRALARLSLAAGLLAPALVLSQAQESDRALCAQIESLVDAVCDCTRTACRPTPGGNREMRSFVVLSSQPVFSGEDSKREWVLVAVAAVGYALNGNATVQGDEVWLSDTEQMRERVAYAVPAEVAKTLQRRIRANQITLDEMYAEILKNMTRKTMPAD